MIIVLKNIISYYITVITFHYTTLYIITQIQFTYIVSITSHTCGDIRSGLRRHSRML